MTAIWGIFWGSVLGKLWPGNDELGMLVGGFLGLFAGLSLRFVIDRQVLSGTQKLQKQAQINAAQIDRLVASSLSTFNTEATKSSDFINSQNADLPSKEGITVETLDVEKNTASQEKIGLEQGTSPPAALAQVNELNFDSAKSNSNATKVKVNSAKPNVIELAFNAMKNWLLGGNSIVRVGLVILFIGLSFLARYAAAAGMVPVELRLAVIGLSGIALLAIGFKKRCDKPGFALALQGAGIAVMYLTVFAAFRLYDLLPALAAFSLMIVVCALSCALALLQNSPALAVAAFTGGFAVPILLSTGQGSHVGLFSYYTLLNLAIMFIAYKKSWRILNVVGFVATFGVATAWGVLKFAPEQYATTQPFLSGFLLIYVITAILYARNTPTKLGNAVDSTLVFGTPLVSFGLQVGLTKQFEFGNAFSALGFAMLYLGLATVLVRRALDNFRLLIESFIALGVSFATLAVPLALDSQWTSAVWAIEGAGAFWVGMRQARWMPRAFGLLLQAVAAIAFLSGLKYGNTGLPLINPEFIGALLIALPALQIAWWLRKDLPHSESNWAKMYSSIEKQLCNPVFVYGFLMWCLALALEINRNTAAKVGSERFIPLFEQNTAQLLTMLSILLSARLFQHFALTKDWAIATWPSRITIVVLMITLLVQLTIGARVLQSPAWLIWPAVLALHYWMLRINDKQDVVSSTSIERKVSYFVHVGGVWLAVLLLADCLWFWIGKGDLWRTAWASVAMLISVIGVLLFLALWAGRANQSKNFASFKWPLDSHATAYYWHAALPLVAMVFFGAFAVAVSSSGRTEPLPYIPLLNPTDLTIALALGALVLWRRASVGAIPLPTGVAMLHSPRAWIALTGLVFIALNTVWLRVAHHFFGVSWSVSSMFTSFVVQTGYAILWSLLALSMMVIADRKKLRTLWLVGAGLLGLVVVKLLLIDLSNAGGAERIIAFIVVGVLMLMVGYFAPLPPKTKAVLGDVLDPLSQSKN